FAWRSARPRGDAPAVLDRRREAVLDVPREVDPLVLLELLHARVDDRAAGGLGIERGEVRLRQELAHELRRAAGIDQIVDQEIALAIAGDAFQHAYTALHLGGNAGASRVVARDADRVHQPDVE